LRGWINTKIIQENYDDVLRLAHSVREGTVSASLLMGKLGSYSRQNSLATALREVGRIEKTIFILDYISSEAMRRRIHRGLNKGEAMNALARAIFLLHHVSPLEWEHINFLGECKFDSKQTTTLKTLRPLNSLDGYSLV